MDDVRHDGRWGPPVGHTSDASIKTQVREITHVSRFPFPVFRFPFRPNSFRDTLAVTFTMENNKKKH